MSASVWDLFWVWLEGWREWCWMAQALQCDMRFSSYLILCKLIFLNDSRLLTCLTSIRISDKNIEQKRFYKKIKFFLSKFDKLKNILVDKLTKFNKNFILEIKILLYLMIMKKLNSKFNLNLDSWISSVIWVVQIYLKLLIQCHKLLNDPIHL